MHVGVLNRCCLDPIAGTKKEAKAYEAQAIGRAYRQGQKVGDVIVCIRVLVFVYTQFVRASVCVYACMISNLS